MFCVCNILKCNVVSCKFDNGKTKISALLSEKPDLSTQDIFYLCGDTLNKVLFSVSQTLQESKIDIKQCCIDKYSTVHSNMLPVITSSKSLIHLHHLSRSYIKSELRLLLPNPCIKLDLQNATKTLSTLKVKDLPYFSNCLDTDNNTVLDDIKYWRKYCSILGISEWDIKKIIPLFECKTKNLPPSETTKDIFAENNSLKEECRALQNAILAEKEKQELLNSTIEEIEQDLGETFQQKEKYMKMVLETSKVLVKLKEDIGAADGFNSIEIGNDFSDESCYCEMCVLQSEINSPHQKLSLSDVFASIKKLVELGNEVETKLRQLTDMCQELQDRNSELEMAVECSNVGSKETHDEIENLRYELLKEKENYQRICQTADQKDSLILELESTISNISTLNEKYKEKLHDYEEKSLKLSADLEESLDALLSNEEELDALKKAMEEKALTLEKAQLQCNEYENKIQLLNSTISKLEEEKALDSFSDGKSQNSISELQDKIESLKKANDSLNVTIETIEEELEKLTMQNILLEEEATNATEKYNCEQEANKKLSSDLRKLEELKVSFEDSVTDLKKKNEILDKDVNLLKIALRGHEQVILENNSSLKIKDRTIDRQNLKISEIEKEKLNLSMQLEENIITVNELTERCSILVNEKKDLESETKKLIENIDEMELQKESLLKDAKELVEARQQFSHHEATHKELVLKYKETCDLLNKEITLRNFLKTELAINQNITNDLDKRFQTLTTTTEQLKLINSNHEEENRVLVQKVKDLEKEIQQANNSLAESYRKQQSVLAENKELFEKLGETQTPAVSHTSDFHNLKTLLSNATQFIISILEVTIHSIKSDSSYPEAEKLKSSLLLALQYWKKCSEMEPKTEKTFNELFDNLKDFYVTLDNKREEELAIHDHLKLIISTSNRIGQFCDSSSQKYQTPNNADVTNMSLFETTTVGNFSDLAQGNHSPSSLVAELQRIEKLLDEYFSCMKSTIHKQEEEIKMFEAKLNDISVKQDSSCAEVCTNSVLYKKKKI